jgi:hypothetical protein
VHSIENDPEGSRELAIGSGLIACEAEHSPALGGHLGTALFGTTQCMGRMASTACR